MDIERETLLQIVVSAVGVITFIAAAAFVGTNYAADGNLTSQGGVAIVGAIGIFIVVMTAAGIWLERQEF